MRLAFVGEVHGPSGQEFVAYDVAPSGDLVTVWQKPLPVPSDGAVLVSSAAVPMSDTEVQAMRSRETRRAEAQRAETLERVLTIRRLNPQTGDVVDARIVPGIEVDRVAVSDGHLVLVGTNWDAEATAVVWDLRSGELRRGLLGWDITDVVVSDLNEIWIGYGDQACYSGPPPQAPPEVAKAMDAGLAAFSLDFELLWNFEIRWDSAPRGIECVYFVHVDRDGGGVVWDGLGDTLTFIEASGRDHQVAWDREVSNLRGVLRAGDDINLLVTDDYDRLFLTHGSPRGREFVVDWSERINVPETDELWRSERWRTRDERVDLVTNGRWYSATLDRLLKQRG